MVHDLERRGASAIAFAAGALARALGGWRREGRRCSEMEEGSGWWLGGGMNRRRRTEGGEQTKDGAGLRG